MAWRLCRRRGRFDPARRPTTGDVRRPESVTRAKQGDGDDQSLCGESTGESGFASFATPDVPGCHAQALPPSWVVGSEATASSVSLTWSPGQEVENCSFLHWEVQVQPENQATYGPAAGCPEASLRNMSSCVVIGLQSATSHTFRVREVCQESTSSSDWAVTSVPISTLLVPAQAPSGLRASEATSSSVTIQWDVPQLNDWLCASVASTRRRHDWPGLAELEGGGERTWGELADFFEEATHPLPIVDLGNWSSSTGCSFFSSSCESTCTANGLPSNAQIDVEAETPVVRVSCTQAEAESDWTSASFQTLPVPWCHGAAALVSKTISVSQHGRDSGNEHLLTYLLSNGGQIGQKVEMCCTLETCTYPDTAAATAAGSWSAAAPRVRGGSTNLVATASSDMMRELNPQSGSMDPSGQVVTFHLGRVVQVPAGAVVQLSLSEIFTGGGDGPALAAYTVELREVFGTWALPSGRPVLTMRDHPGVEESASLPVDRPVLCRASSAVKGLQGLNCDSNYEVRVAANCTNPLASGPFATVSFTTDVGELCLKQAPAPRSVMATALGVSSLAVAWVDASANASRNCSFSEWQVELRPSSSEGWSSACRVLELQVTDCVASGLPSNTAHHFRVREVCDDVGTWGYTAAAVSTAPVAAAPMVVQASSPQVSQMLVQWSSPELNDCLFSRFKLQWSVDSSSWQEVACGASNFCDSSCSAQSLPSNTAVTFRGRTICTEEALNGEWSNSSVPVSTLPRPSEPLVVHVNVWSYDAAELSWSRPVLNDCILQGWQVELLDSNLWTSGPGCQGLTADATGCNLTNLACDSDFQARVSTRCHSALADAEPRSVSFRTAAGAECLKRAGAPLGVLLLATSVSSATLTWEVQSSIVHDGGLAERRGTQTGASRGRIGVPRRDEAVLSLRTKEEEEASHLSDGRTANIDSMDQEGILCDPEEVAPLGWGEGTSKASGLAKADDSDCTFASWAVQLSPTEPGPSFSCASSLRDREAERPTRKRATGGTVPDSTSCIFSGLAENSSYVASIQELCAESSLASPSALSQVATTFSVPWPSVALQLPFPDETVERRPEECEIVKTPKESQRERAVLMVMYDVDVELPVVGSVKSLVAKLVDLSCRHCIRKCKESCKHDRAIICKGRKGFGLGLFVFTYDQRIPTSLWDHHTVLRRGLTVLVPLPEPFRDREDGSPLELSVLEEATQNDSPLEVAECMPKFFEADESTLKGLQSFSTEDLQLEAILEKVDGSLGLLHPPRDPATLEVIDGLPLLSSKSVGYSSDIAQVRVMLEEQHPNLRLPEGVTSLIVEVVRPEVQVCVPYSYQGFRLLAVMKEGAWLWEDAADAMAQELGMERPKRLSFEHVKPRGYGAGEAPSLSDVMAKAQAYVMGEDPHTLEEGWVVVFRNGLRLKVHTEVWNMVHAWWSNRINTKTVLPLLEDPRINQVPFSSLRECLCGPAATEKRRQNADALEALLRKLKPIYEECQVELRNVVKETAKKSLKELKVNGHPLVKIIQMVRGRQGWVESIPEEVDLETLLLSNEAVRHMFLPRAARAERELETTLDAAVLQGIETKLLRAVQMCLEVLPKNTTVPALEKDLQKPLPEEMVPLISGKGLILPDAFQRLTAVLARRTVAPEASRCKSDE
ncbi:Uncharacterized protein SCF082_LOCUS24016 [Durusdinium trenchii]|uniref:Fibronectin type-III domain-containing protein n=1 Tax=Durusdinium trenchii TaxID=1381693 RepID=A0ABP0LSB6_9DINO